MISGIWVEGYGAGLYDLSQKLKGKSKKKNEPANSYQQAATAANIY